ncbi:MAG: serine/threonine-protein kinase [Myxococcota bacterium]
MLELLRGLARPPPALEDEGPLGHGGMGVVRLATQVPLGRKVAVKKLAPGNTRPDDVEALLSEAWLAGALEHPNIVPVHDLGLDEHGLPVLVMKRIEGRSWSTLLRDADALAAHAPGRAPLEAHLRILIQVCNALHFAHARGVVHRDLKPDNVMVGAFGEVYLVDWGIAVAPGPAPQLAGTPVYMAPEMLGGERAVISPATDVYLLGAVLFELLTGKPPHDASTPERLTTSVLASAPALPDDAPMELAALVRLCMSADPAHRPASALAVRLALESFLAHLGSLELTAQAEQRLAELRALLAREAPDARRVFDLFSECRFAFQQALRTWPENVRARHGLDASVRAMVGFELAAGSARTAQALLSELHAPDAALAAQVDAAVAQEARRKEQLEALERHHDPRAGASARFFVLFTAGVAWIIAPLVGRRLIAAYPDHEMLFSAAVSLASTLGISLGSRFASNARTKLNTQLVHMLLFAMNAQTVALLAVYFAYGDIGAKVAPILTGAWSFLAGLIASALMKEAWLTAIGYLASTLLAVVFPEYRYEAVALGNVVFTLNAVWMWRRFA